MDSRNTCCSPALPVILLLHTQCSGQGLDCPLGLMRNGKKGFPPHTHTTPTVDSLVTRNGPRNKNQTNQRSPDDSPWDEGTKQLVEMAPRGKVALFVCPSTPFFLDTLGLRHGDLKESAQKSYVLNQDFAFNHLSKRKRASPAHVLSKTSIAFQFRGFLSCLVQVALGVKINENYIKIQRHQQRTASVSEIIFPFSRTRALFFVFCLGN